MCTFSWSLFVVIILSVLLLIGDFHILELFFEFQFIHVFINCFLLISSFSLSNCWMNHIWMATMKCCNENKYMQNENILTKKDARASEVGMDCLEFRLLLKNNQITKSSQVWLRIRSKPFRRDWWREAFRGIRWELNRNLIDCYNAKNVNIHQRSQFRTGQMNENRTNTTRYCENG